MLPAKRFLRPAKKLIGVATEAFLSGKKVFLKNTELAMLSAEPFVTCTKVLIMPPEVK